MCTGSIRGCVVILKWIAAVIVLFMLLKHLLHHEYNYDIPFLAISREHNGTAPRGAGNSLRTNQHGRPDKSHVVSQNNWTRPEFIPGRIKSLAQSDDELIDHISRYWLLPPASVPLELEEPDREHHSQANQSQIVDELLNRKRNGFFVECGAANGELFSNSLFFEKSRNWTGVLIEAEPEAFYKMVDKHRHSFLINACLSPTNTPMTIPFRTGGVLGALANYMSEGHARRMDKALANNSSNIIMAQCFPVFSILQAIGVSHVDYFSLDIEGAELDVLRTLPLDQLTVDVFSIEHSGGELQGIFDLMVGKHGYRVISRGLDIILKRERI